MEDILPIFWEDNYFSLLPFESKIITVLLYSNYSENELDIIIETWNNIIGNRR